MSIRNEEPLGSVISLGAGTQSSADEEATGFGNECSAGCGL